MFVPKGPIDNKSALVQVMACHRIGDKPLPEPMLTQFTTHRHQCGNLDLTGATGRGCTWSVNSLPSAENSCTHVLDNDIDD